MTVFIVYTILMTILNIMNGVITYRIFKHLSKEANMGKNKKWSKKAIVNKVEDKQIIASISNEVRDDIDVNQDFDGSFSNPFSDREMSYLTPQSSETIEVLPKPEEELSHAIDKDFNYKAVNSDNANSSSNNSGDSNIPIVTQDTATTEPEDDRSMLGRLLYLSDFINERYQVSSYLNEEEWENMKWETINETYCLITVDLPRSQAEIIRKYFRRLDTTYVKKDGTYYSLVVSGAIAKDVIDDLIRVFPWHELDEKRIKVNLDGFHKESIDKHPKQENDDSVYGEKLKYAIGNLSKSVDKLNEILLGK